MEIEIFKNEVVEDEMSALADEGTSLSLIKELGLSGQQGLVDETEHGSIMPYNVMTKEQEFTAKVFCPKKSEVEDFKYEQIPARVLEEIKSAKDLNFFSIIEIWYPEVAEVKDPFVIGIHLKNPKVTYWDRTQYLIARWGDELLPFPEMTSRAFAMWRARKETNLKKAIKDFQRELEDIFDLTEHNAASLDPDPDVSYSS